MRRVLDNVHVCSGTCIHMSDRDLLLVRLVSEGLTNPQIAVRMDRSLQTVRNNLALLYTRLGVHSRIQLALEVAQWELDAARKKKKAQGGSVYYRKGSRQWVAAITAGVPKKIMVYCNSKKEAENALMRLNREAASSHIRFIGASA